ncbi:hypothetical protein D3C72_2269240 [compost metagenome]
MHGLAGQVFAHRRAQYGAAVAHAGIRRHARALELQFPSPLRTLDFAQKVGAPVAKLARPDAKLVTAVDGGQGVATRQRLGTGKYAQKFGRR